MPTITPEQARSYFGRWDLVREVEASELERATVDSKVRKLASLMASRHLFPLEPDREAQIEQVRARWALLRKALGG